MNYDVAIVGAGIVGLSTAYKLLERDPGLNVVVLEKEDGVAVHQTGRNSGVIHSGIYYRPGSYRAMNCLDGRHQLVAFCQKEDVVHDICGKIIVAVEEEELPRLQKIYERGLENGIEGIRIIDEQEIAEIEPWSAGIRAIHVPCSGIVDFAGVCRKLASRIQEAGGEIRFKAPVTSISEKNGELKVRTDKETVNCHYLINCAGLYSDHVARSAGVRTPVQIVPFRGEYFRLINGAADRVKGLIYPLPNPEFPFLGVHFTRMALGGVECGPNAVFAFKREGYKKLSFNFRETIETVNFPGFWRLARQHWRMGLDEYHRSFSRNAFLTELQRLMPWIGTEHLEASPSGVRAMALNRDGSILDDFRFEKARQQLHVVNAPSPAATAALAVADEILRQADF